MRNIYFKKSEKEKEKERENLERKLEREGFKGIERKSSEDYSLLFDYVYRHTPTLRLPEIELRVVNGSMITANSEMVYLYARGTTKESRKIVDLLSAEYKARLIKGFYTNKIKEIYNPYPKIIF